MGSYNPNPPPDSDAPAATAAEAEARAGKDVGFRGTYGGVGGRASQNWELVQQNERIRQQQAQQNQQGTEQQSRQGTSPSQNPYNPRIQPGRYSQWARDHPQSVAMSKQQADSEYDQRDVGAWEYTSGRSRFVSTLDFGDSKTQESVRDLSGEARFSAIGVTLERQRQEALKTPGTRDDRYFQNQLDLWNAQSVERSAGYHAYGKMSGRQISANPYENVGDIALAIEKAGNQKDNLGKNYAFNPNVGSVLQVLPQKRDANGNLSPVGLQEYGWMGAVARDRGGKDVGAVSFMPAIEFLNSQRGRQGIYGNLSGGIKDTFTPLPKGFSNGGILGELTKSTQKTAYTEPKRPFVSINAPAQRPTEDQLFADSTVSRTYRPSDQTLFVMNAPGMQTSGRGQGIGKMLVGISDFMFPGSFVETRTGKRQEISRGQYDKLFQSGQPMATFKYIDPDTNKPVDKMTFKVGEEYTKEDGKTYQDYKTSDLSKVTIVPVKTNTVATKSGYDTFQEGISDKIYRNLGKAFNVTGEQAKQSVGIADIFARGVGNKSPATNWAMGTGMLKETLDRPVEGVAIFAVSAATGGGFRGIERIGARLAPTAIKMLPRTAKTVSALWSGIPYVAGAVYGGQAAYRITDRLTDFQPGNMASRFGGMIATETVPMVGGFTAGYYSPEIAAFAYRSASRAPGEFSNAWWSTRQRMAGIERIPPGTTSYDFTITQMRPTTGARGSTPNSVFYERLMPPKQKYYGGFDGQVQYTPKPQNWEGMSKSQQVSWMKGNYKSWIDTDAGRLYTYKGYSASRRPSFDNEAGMVSFGGSKRYSPQKAEPSGSFWENRRVDQAGRGEFIPQPQRAPIHSESGSFWDLRGKTRYAESRQPLNIKIQSEGELALSTRRSPMMVSLRGPASSLTSRMNSRNSLIELERIQATDRERAMSYPATWRSPGMIQALQPQTQMKLELQPSGNKRTRTGREMSQLPALFSQSMPAFGRNPKTDVITSGKPNTSLMRNPDPFRRNNPSPNPYQITFPELSLNPQRQPGLFENPQIRLQTPTIPPIWLPSLGSGLEAGYGRKRRGRRFTETFETGFGQLTRNLFGNAQRKRPSKKKKARR
ncbi:MAG: hypothetical protein M0Q91_15090 [Methanoregula sp.]|jgi:hypothetical protein|nr:hypothetical protein [Methanoregula sp.]